MDSVTDDLTDVAENGESSNSEADPAIVADMNASMASLSEAVLMLPFTEARARALEAFDRAFLSAALARNSGNIARTARSLGLHRQSLQKLMARRGIKSGRAT